MSAWSSNVTTTSAALPKNSCVPDVERFGKTRVDNSAIEAFACKLRRGFARQRIHVAQAEQRHLAFAVVGEVLDYFRFADFQQAGLVFDGHSFRPPRG